MPDSEEVQGFLQKRDRNLAEWLITLILFPASLLYRFGMFLRGILYRIGLLRTTRLPVKVISVGGISLGGSGKTPVVMHIVDLLESTEKKAVVLTRGYGGETTESLALLPGDDLTGIPLSDEVRLMSERINSPIGVGADRVRSFELLEKRGSYDVAVLDDGFQHLRIARDLDIVVLDATAPYGSGFMLPAGNLREPKRALRRADLIVLTRLSQSANPDRMVNEVERRVGGNRLITADYRFETATNIHTGQSVSLVKLESTKTFAFSAIANPASFFSMLRDNGINPKGSMAFRDHHIYTESDVEQLLKEARSLQCEAFAVTEKDAVKLREFDFESLNVYSIRIHLQIQKGKDNLHSSIMGLLDD